MNKRGQEYRYVEAFGCIFEVQASSFGQIAGFRAARQSLYQARQFRDSQSDMLQLFSHLRAFVQNAFLLFLDVTGLGLASLLPG